MENSNRIYNRNESLVTNLTAFCGLPSPPARPYREADILPEPEAVWPESPLEQYFPLRVQFLGMWLLACIRYLILWTDLHLAWSDKPIPNPIQLSRGMCTKRRIRFFLRSRAWTWLPARHRRRRDCDVHNWSGHWSSLFPRRLLAGISFCGGSLHLLFRKTVSRRLPDSPPKHPCEEPFAGVRLHHHVSVW